MHPAYLYIVSFDLTISTYYTIITLFISKSIMVLDNVEGEDDGLTLKTFVVYSISIILYMQIYEYP